MLKRLLIATVVAVPCLLLAAKLSQSDEQANRRILVIQAMDVDSSWVGTGFLVNTESGVQILTNRHVCSNAVTITVRYNDEHIYRPAKLVRVSSSRSDLCLLKPDSSVDVSAGGYDLAPNAGLLPMGVTVYGYPQGKPLTYYSAEIMMTKRIQSGANDYFNGMLVAELDAPTIPGSSGSPVLNGKGELVAVICGLQHYADGSVKGLAVPLSSIKQFLFNRGDQ